MSKVIAIGMPVKEIDSHINRAIYSILNQKDYALEVKVVIGVQSNLNEDKVNHLSWLKDPRVIIVQTQANTISENRNAINNYIRNNVKEVALIGRLDSDDYLCNEYVIRQIEEQLTNHEFDVLLMGNKQSLNGKIITWQNKPSKKLLDYSHLHKRLSIMAQGDPKGELPSCNVFIKSHLNINYPSIPSAEDHWFLVSLLMNKESYNIHVAENVLYCVYSLSGDATKTNKTKTTYWLGRKKLLEYFEKETNWNQLTTK